MENFDLKKFLVENKLTSNSRLLNEVWDKENWLLHNAGIDYKERLKILLIRLKIILWLI